MNDLRRYSKEFITEFIDLYKSLPAVWKVKSEEYASRELKTQAYEILIEKWREVEPKADREFVVKRINSMRSIYRRELKRMENDLEYMAAEDVRSPSLWYFHLLDFLRDYTLPRPSYPNLEVDNSQNADYKIESVSIPTSPQSPETPQSPPSSPSSSVSTPRPKKRRQDPINNVPAKIIKREPELKLDRFDHMAHAWAETLRSLPKDQRIVAEKLIGEVLCEAQFNTLTRASRLQVQRSP